MKLHEKENNMNMEKYSGLQTDITTEQSKTSYSKEVNKTDGDVNKQKKEESDEKNINIDLKKGSKSKDKKNKKCIIW